jgi:two-component system, NarL family, sensor kinase
VKHSSAEKVTIDLSAELDRLRLQVRDDGVGFDTAADHVRSGLGLTSMRERLRMIGGKLAVTSSLGQGTQIEALAPLPEKAHILA